MLFGRVRLLALILVSLCFSALMSGVLSAPAFAAPADDPITITSQTDTIAFPNAITFRMNATDSTNVITQATINITLQTPGGAVPETHTAQITSGRTISASWRENTGGNNFLLPGTQISYSWQIQDIAQHTHTGQTEHFTMIDTRFAWQHLSQGFLQVDWYNQPLSFGQLLLAKASSSIAHIKSILGSGLNHQINLWVYGSDQDFHGALPPGTFEWVGGEALPQLNEALISVQSTDDFTLVRDMPHELTHLVFHQLVAHGINPPTWFDEGLAVYNQIYHEPEMTIAFKEALQAKALLPLNNISFGFPSDANQAELAYAQSWNLVDYMYKTFGTAKMNNLIRLMDNPQADFGQDLQQALGVDQAHLENQWHLSLNQPPVPGITNQAPPAAQTTKPQTQLPSTVDNSATLVTTLGVTLILLALIGILAVMIISRRRRQRVWAVEAAEQIISNTLRDPSGFQSGNQAPYTHPSAYMPPPARPLPPQGPGPNGQFPYYQPGQPFGGPTPGGPSPQNPPFRQDQYPGYGGPTPPPFRPGQEPPDPRTRWQAPQE